MIKLVELSDLKIFISGWIWCWYFRKKLYWVFYACLGAPLCTLTFDFHINTSQCRILSWIDLVTIFIHLIHCYSSVSTGRKLILCHGAKPNVIHHLFQQYAVFRQFVPIFWLIAAFSVVVYDLNENVRHDLTE